MVRYAIDSSQIAALASKLPDNIEGELVEPAVQGVIFKVLARYTDGPFAGKAVTSSSLT
mgnify:CR=1 FL=1